MWWEGTYVEAHKLLMEGYHYISELRKNIADNSELIKGYQWTEPNLKRDLEAMHKSRTAKLEKLDKESVKKDSWIE